MQRNLLNSGDSQPRKEARENPVRRLREEICSTRQLFITGLSGRNQERSSSLENENGNPRG